jgi:hypothetical protein
MLLSFFVVFVSFVLFVIVVVPKGAFRRDDTIDARE